MKPLALILAFAAVTSAQKPLKGSKHKPAYIAHSPGAGAEAAPQYQHQQQAPQHPAISNHGGFGGGSGGHHGGGGGSYSSGIGKGDSKRIFPQLLSDTRTLNPDGTINFDYKADNGLHQGESVDSDGTRRGFYSYPGADGKLITVKYTAGKNGFVAEGPHLPTQPQSAPYNSKQDDNYSSGKQGSTFGGLGGGHFAQGSPQHHGGNQGAYRPSQGLGGHGNHGQQASHYSHSSGLGGGSGGGGGGGAASFANFPDFSSHFPSSSGGKHGHGFGSGDSSSFIGFSQPRSLNAPNHHFIVSHQQPQAQNQINNIIGSPSYSSGAAGGAGAGRYSGAGGAGGHGLSAHPGGSSSFSSLGGLGGLGGGHGGSGASLADIQSSLGQQQYSGPMFTANNPYQPSLESANPSNPVNAGFDLGNGGHFAINFTPGQAQEYNVNDVGDYGGQGGQGGHGGQVTNYGGGGSSGQGGGAQGRY